MVIRITAYECEVCGQKYNSPIKAENCEAVKPPVFPIGTMHQTAIHRKTFCVCKNHVKQHENHVTVWVAEHVGVSHSYSLAGLQISNFKLGHDDKVTNQNWHSFKTMCSWLCSQGIFPRVWDGERAVLIDDHIRLWDGAAITEHVVSTDMRLLDKHGPEY